MAEEKKVVVLGPPAFGSPNPETMRNSMYEGTTAKRVVGLNDHPVSEDSGEVKTKKAAQWIEEVEAATDQDSLDAVANAYSESGKEFTTVVAAIEKKQAELDADDGGSGDGQ